MPVALLVVVGIFTSHAQNTSVATNVTQLTTTTTTTTVPTTPKPTTTSTLSPEQIYHQSCLNLTKWVPTEALTCSNPFALCFFDVFDATDKYLECKTYLNETQPSKVVSDTDPLIVASYIYRMSRNIISAFEYIKLTNPFLAGRDSARKAIAVKAKHLFATGLQYRYGDHKWPDYQDNIFQNQRPRKKWNKRNDSITILYESLPRQQDYQCFFAAYENLVDLKITDKENVRLMDKWPDHHPIWQGSYMDYMAEPSLYYKDNLIVNTAVLQVDIKP